ncbi:terpene synthase [Streptomyces avermitilis]|uniref:terpene synthase family protein n=1 Tax=Streptomyces avermitilis TaxID=33903 RepID=UPI0033BE8195
MDSRAVDWVHHFSLSENEAQRKRLERVEAGRLAALVSPRGELEATQLTADFLMWLFAFDDAHCDEGTLGRRPNELSRVLIRLLRILEAPEAPLPSQSSYHSFEAALLDVRLRMQRHATQTQMDRWTDAMRMYFLCQVWEAANRVEEHTPDLNSYALLRIHNGAMRVSVALLDVAEGYELPPEDLARADVRALIEATCLLVGWDNDILSYQKERTRGGGTQNLLDVLAHVSAKSAAEMLPDAMFLRDQIMVLFAELSAKVCSTASYELNCYVTSLGDWIRANLEWGISCERYIAPGHPATLPRISATDPSPGSNTPADIPAIAWWWNQR